MTLRPRLLETVFSVFYAAVVECPGTAGARTRQAISWSCPYTAHAHIRETGGARPDPPSPETEVLSTEFAVIKDSPSRGTPRVIKGDATTQRGFRKDRPGK